jgi:hypothetical protein
MIARFTTRTSGSILIVLLLLVGCTPLANAAGKKALGELTWEMPGRLSIYDLQFGPAVLKKKTWHFLGNIRSLDAGQYKDRLTLMVRFSYRSSKPQIPLKFVIKLPKARQYEETVNLTSRKGRFAYRFTIHRPQDFTGSGSVYLYYGFSIVDVLDFTIRKGS